MFCSEANNLLSRVTVLAPYAKLSSWPHHNRVYPVESDRHLGESFLLKEFANRIPDGVKLSHSYVQRFQWIFIEESRTHKSFIVQSYRWRNEPGNEELWWRKHLKRVVMPHSNHTHWSAPLSLPRFIFLTTARRSHFHKPRAIPLVLVHPRWPNPQIDIYANLRVEFNICLRPFALMVSLVV